MSQNAEGMMKALHKPGAHLHDLIVAAMAFTFYASVGYEEARKQ
jgi:hypothetical protein